MVLATKQREKDLLLSKIVALHTYFTKNNDTERKKKAEQLAEKLHDEQYTIAFCGHFSAGKSTMINRLVGENLLPSSPIPTSANLVTVKTGEDYAKVFFHYEKPHLYPAPYDYEAVKSYCKDGDEIKAIEISVSNSLLPKGAVIMDTPGIDSTDDAHRVATESALHLADLVFYVMDYNHVQSEVNFLFTKELYTAGKELYLIINQIDKHREEELSFTSFKESVKNSFAAWGIQPANIFYTSLKETTHPYNQFSELQQFISDKFTDRFSILSKSVFSSVKKVTDEHLHFLLEKNKQEIDGQESILATLPEKERSQISENLAASKEELHRLENDVERFIKQYDEDLKDILKNAYLMPFQTREKAERFLEASQSDFKIGLFFSKQKTVTERMKRLVEFYQHVQKNVETQLDWHLREFMMKMIKEHEITHPGMMHQAQAIAVQFDEQLLESLVKKGARLSGDYVLNYTNDVSQQLKKLAKKTVLPLKMEMITEINKKNETKQQMLQKEIETYTHFLQAANRLKEISEQQLQVTTDIDDLLARTDIKEADLKKATELIEQLKQEEVIIRDSVREDKLTLTNELSREKEPSLMNRPIVQEMKNNEELVSNVIEQLQLTAQEINKLPGFSHTAQELIERANRLDQRGFTVALFGAFSAGKSSFANALIGEKLLPVSPNPTTATINKIMPTNDQFQHGTARVKLKEPEHLLEDVNRSLHAFELNATSLVESIELIEKVLQSTGSYHPSIEMHRSFLNAFYLGFPVYREQLGNILEVEKEQFQDFVAKEEQSCLVEWIEVYVDCELTRKGITIVDTPGADSINARHTSVAFDYIKNADACFYVTYYNHAFSKADREFLIQLGRVKDSFELDKMFFIINAIDLASSNEELEMVLHYVQEQLVQYGIRQPNMYPVSSLLGLTEKLSKSEVDNSRLKQFEQAFYGFLANDIVQVTVQAAQLELKRIAERIEQLIQSAQEDQALKKEKQKKIEIQKTEAIELLHNQHASLLQTQLQQEADELVFYVKQRVFLRFNDFFKESINPAVIKDDGRDVKKSLAIAFDEFLQSFGFDFAQEMRATTLRLEVFMRKQLAMMEQTLVKNLLHMNQDFSFQSFEVSPIDIIDFERAFKHLTYRDFKQAFTYFKNPKSFFEKNERQLMGDVVEQQLQDLADQYLLTENERMKVFYDTVVTEEFARLIQHLWKQINEYYDGVVAIYQDDFLAARFVEVKEKMSKQITKNKQ